MHDDRENQELANYRLFVNRVDELCDSINRQFAERIACRAGCSSCCRHLSLFPVEAAALVEALATLPEPSRRILAKRGKMPEDGPCPLLQNDRCLAYGGRPIICRTHGLPLLTETDGNKNIDFCPENFRGITAIPGDAVMNLDLVNRTLVAINAVFVRETTDPAFRSRERYSIADLVLMAQQVLLSGR